MAPSATRLLAAAALLGPALAAGQTLSPGQVTVSDLEISIAECRSDTTNHSISWNASITGGAIPTTSDEFRVFVSTDTTTCPTSLPAGTPYDTRFYNGQDATGSVTKQIADLKTALAVNCDSLQDLPYRICVYLVQGGNVIGTAGGTSFGGTAFKFQLALPPAPSITSVDPADGALQVAFAAGSASGTEVAATRYQIEATAASDPALHRSDVTTPGRYRISGLQNGVQYTVVARGFSSAGNQGPDSQPALGTPVPSSDFWETYRQAGGREEGGCASGAAGALALAGLLAALALRRRRA